MKNLKLILSVLVLAMGAIFFVNAQNCVYNSDPNIDAYDCNPGEICNQPNCLCELSGPGFVTSGNICGVACTYNPDPNVEAYDCNPGEYCDQPNCLCPSGSITNGAVCSPSTVFCTSPWGTVVHVGQSITGYQSNTVPNGSGCGGQFFTCQNVGGVGVFSPNISGYNFNSCIVSPPPTGSCSLPWGGTIASGSYVTAYQSSSVACGSTCTSQIRTCNAGVLNGSYTFGTCSPSCTTPGGGSSGGGGSSTPTCTFVDLMCVGGTYQKKPGVNCINGNLGNACSGTGIVITTGNTATGAGLNPVNYTKIGDISNSPYSQELNLAYLYAYNMGITTMSNIFKADLEGKLIRSHMAKMMVQWSKKVIGVKANTGIVCDFDDIDYLKGQDLYAFIIQSCQMGLMGVDNKGKPKTSFDPTGVVTRAQFGTVLSRAIRGDYYNGGDPFYNYHLEALNSVEIMKKISQPWDYELRGWVMLMLHRAHTKLVK